MQIRYLSSDPCRPIEKAYHVGIYGEPDADPLLGELGLALDRNLNGISGLGPFGHVLAVAVGAVFRILPLALFAVAFKINSNL